MMAAVGAVGLAAMAHGAGRADRPNVPAYSVWSEDGRTLHGVAVRSERWRYAELADGGAMLLDPINDPQELRNFVDDPKLAEVRADLSKRAQDYAGRQAEH
ncbi:MAG: hypothetical protein ACREIA_16890 [Opitutaceae bacterium]